ncbi:MAG: death-on-curing protein [Chitinophagales bacterium]|nr:MAG: death-on-curing protein [Chitinophagales bacterium]
MHKGEIEIYQTSDGTKIQVKLEQDTVWLDAHLMAKLFGVQRPAVVKHIGNIYKSRELDERATCSILEQVASDGKIRKMKLYNLDMIISVGYRVNSIQATQFRQWATQRLKDYLVQGYAINEKRLQQRNMQVEQLKTGIRILSRAIEEKAQEQGIHWLNDFAKGLQLLDDYDHEQLDTRGKTCTKAVYPGREQYQRLINQMKAEFNSDVFGVEKDKGFDSAIAQIAQGFGEEDAYPSLEEKAAMLLYLITKNHAFADGNKRIAAACFLLFLEENNMLFNANGQPIISNEALAGLTLFTAASKPEEMETVKKLIISILNRNKP